MAWSFDQQVRLQQERQILSKFLKSYDLQWSYTTEPGRACIDVQMRTNAGIQYLLRLFIPIDFPNSVPSIYIVNPTLHDVHGNLLAPKGPDAVMHLLEPRNGWVQICHYRSTHWTPNVTLYKVFMKARLWLEAFEGHKVTGHNLDYYLPHQ